MAVRVLHDFGIELMTKADGQNTQHRHALAYRDGLLISLLAARALRLRNLAGLILGRTLFLPEGSAGQIYGAADAVVAGALRPSGAARLTPGGYRVSGHWGFASGIDHCAWWNGGCIVYDGETPRLTDTGAPQSVLVFFPATDGERIDTWDTGGLRGTGSHD